MGVVTFGGSGSISSGWLQWPTPSSWEAAEPGPSAGPAARRAASGLRPPMTSGGVQQVPSSPAVPHSVLGAVGMTARHGL